MPYYVPDVGEHRIKQRLCCYFLRSLQSKKWSIKDKQKTRNNNNIVVIAMKKLRFLDGVEYKEYFISVYTEIFYTKCVVIK